MTEPVRVSSQDKEKVRSEAEKRIKANESRLLRVRKRLRKYIRG